MLRILNSEEWTLSGFLPETYKYNMDRGTVNNFRCVPLVFPLKASVPGSVHLDLWHNGVIENPFFGTNNLKCEWVEHKEWVYRTVFRAQGKELTANSILVFEGVNNQSEFYLNGEFLGSHYNVNTAASFDVTGKLRDENELVVVIKSVEQEEQQMGSTSHTRHQTQRFAFGWDFSTRMVGVGIVKDVKLYTYTKSLLRDVYIRPCVCGKDGVLTISGKCEEGMTLEAEVFDGTVHIKSTYAVGKSFRKNLRISDVKLWYPFHYGEQHLYRVVLTLKNGDETEDVREYEAGFRTAEYVRESNSHENSLAYTVKINGKKVWLCGVNMINLSQLVGGVTDKDYEFYLRACRDMNINMVRIWGGNILERDILYQLADRLGILIFQDFHQSSSGEDSYPSEDKNLVSELMKSCRETILKTRNHASVIIYCGGNELRNRDYSIIDANHPLLVRMRKEVERLSPHVYFHYTTPSGINFNFSPDEASLREHRNENIHGHYAYLGIREHYAYYNQGDYNFQCEFGCNGCCDEDSLADMMTPDEIAEYKKPLTLSWLNRNSGWYNCYPRDKVLFGEDNMADVGRYSAASQLIQAEGVRYIIERNRDRAFECSGCAIWQLNEPWANSNCTTLIDYFKRTKLVCKFVRDAYAPLNVNMKYSSLFCRKGEPLGFEIYLSSLIDAFEGEVSWELFNLDGVFAQEKVSVRAEAGKAVFVKGLDQVADDSFGKVFGVRLRAVGKDGSTAENIYLFSTQKETPFAELFEKKSSLLAELSSDGRTLELENTGRHPVLFVKIYGGGKEREEVSDNFISLMPGEKRSVRIARIPSEGLFVKDFTRSVRFQIKNREE